MAACLLVSTPPNFSLGFQPTRLVSHKAPAYVTVAKLLPCATGSKAAYSPVARRSGNYQPCIWDTNYLQSLRNDYTGETYRKRAEKLKEDVKMMLSNTVRPLDQLELIDALQRLGLAYHFEEEINNTLSSIYENSNDNWKQIDLYATALEFRLLRQHGYHVPQEVFERFKDKMGSFKACNCEDVRAMLSLYEASYFSVEGESIMEDAWLFTTKHLKDLNMDVDPYLDMQVSHALELPLHWRMPRSEARWFIDVYERRGDMNPVLLELAKLDFNIVQALHQEELRDMSSWWKNTGLGEKMSFARDRLVESYLWGMGITFEPQNGYCRGILTKAVQLITMVDDIYDVYGTLDELELFTEAMERWDINLMKQLPDYMKMCFLAVYNWINEMVYVILKEQGSDVLSHLKKAWLGLLKAYLVEARWYHSGYKPTLEEYMNNGCISIAGPIMTVLAYISVTNPIKKEALEFLESNPEILLWASVTFRLSDDYGTSTDELKRGDVPKSIQCHMYDTGASEEVSRKYMRDLMRQTWKKMNRYRVADSPLQKSIIEIMLNIVRVAHFMYQHGDGHGTQDAESRNRVLSLLVEPIPL